MRFAILLALAVALAACGAAGQAPTTTTTSTSPTTSVTTTTSPPTASSTTVVPSPTVTDATTTTAVDPYRFEVTVSESQVTGGGRVEVPLGETVTFVVTVDVADEVHVHGYDLMVDTQPGVPVSISFTTAIPGTVEIELENAGLVLVELRSS